jgi:hypothetical protein
MNRYSSRVALRRSTRLAFVCALSPIALAAPSQAPSTNVLPRAVSTRVEKIADRVSATTIHGWNTCRLVRRRGVLFASAAVSNPKAADYWDHGGAFFRQRDGRWDEVGRLPFNPYTMAVAPDGTFWVVAPSSYTDCRVYRSRAPGDLSELEEVHRGTCSYLGAAIGPEGNFVVVYAESADSNAGTPNTVTAAFYEHASGRWHVSRIATPEGRYGYEGIVLRGKQAIAVLNSSLTDPEHSDAKGTRYSWRHVRIARCEDLTKGEWIQSGWLLPQDGRTALQDLIVGPDGDLYLSYSHVAAASHEDLLAIDQVPHRLARIHDDLSVETFETGLQVGASRLLVDPGGGFHLVGRCGAGGLRIWDLDRERGFRAGAPRELTGTDALEDYVVHTLCPERFGGESGADTVYLLGARSPPDPPGKERADVELWLASFRWADL